MTDTTTAMRGLTTDEVQCVGGGIITVPPAQPIDLGTAYAIYVNVAAYTPCGGTRPMLQG